MSAPKLCRHCQQPRNWRNRGLCWSCYQTLSIRAQYPIVANCYVRRGLGIDAPKPLTMPDFPTSALPGSEEKQAVMQARVEAHQHIFHPQDATFEDAPSQYVEMQVDIDVYKWWQKIS